MGPQIVDQVGNAMGNHPGFARPGPGQDAQGSVHRDGSLQLTRTEGLFQIHRCDFCRGGGPISVWWLLQSPLNYGNPPHGGNVWR